MKKGKVLTNPLIRSVLRHPFLQKETDHLASDGAVLGRGKEGETPVFGAAVNTTVYGGPHAEALAFYRSLNSALAAGIRPESLLLSLTIPLPESEKVLNARMERLEALAERENLRISGGSTSVSDSISRPVMTAIISGKFDLENGYGQETGKRANIDGFALLMTGYAGDAGAGLVLEEKRGILKTRFTEEFLSGAEIGEEALSVRKAAEILRREGAVMHDVSEGGVFSALYTFAEGHACGFTADLLKILIRQETVEICGYFDWNPYEMLSTGALLAAVPDGDRALQALKAQGIPAARIGCLTEGKKKILLRGGEERFLERPHEDPVTRLQSYG